EACARAMKHGYDIVGRDDSDQEWKEAFLHPKQALGIVVQIVETSWSAGDGAPTYWTPPASPPDPPPPVTIVGLRLQAASRERAHGQWGDVLQGECAMREDELIYRWPGSPLRLAVSIAEAGDEGPLAVEYSSDRSVALPAGRNSMLGTLFTRLRGRSVQFSRSRA